MKMSHLPRFLYWRSFSFKNDVAIFYLCGKKPHPGLNELISQSREIKEVDTVLVKINSRQIL